jgi:hypothetical protein
VSEPTGYSGKPLARKLGVRAGDALLLISAPTRWRVPELPAGVRASSERHGAGTERRADVIVAFHSQLATLRESIPALAPRIFPDGALWTAWPRRAGGHDSDIREQDIRDVALPLGLVDVKVAAIDEDWSGLRLVWRRELRHTSEPTPG